MSTSKDGEINPIARQPNLGEPRGNSKIANSRFRSKPNSAPRSNASEPGKPAASVSATRPAQQKPSAGVKTTPKEEQVFRDSIFGLELSGVEDNTRISFNTTHSGLVSLSEMVFGSLVVRESNLDKKLLVEALRYYTSALFWLRVIDLKVKNSLPLTVSERQLFDMFHVVEFTVPEPLYLYYKAMGNVVEVTGEHMLPSYPPLPEAIVAGFGGFFNPGVITEATHTLYEEYPAMGIAAENLRVALGPQNDGAYASIVVPPGTTANENLLGYSPLAYRRPEAKARFQTCGITPAVIREDVPNTAFNYAALQVVSSTLATTSVFKNITTTISAIGANGSIAQTVMNRPVMTQATTRCADGDTQCTSLTQCTDAIYGIASSFGFQVWKENAVGLEPRVTATTWCCVNFTAAHDLPQEWVINRNVRRDIPVRYTDAVFKTVSVSSWQLRRRIVTKLEKES